MLMNMLIGQNLVDKQITLIMLVLSVRIGALRSLFGALHACSIWCAILTSRQTWPLWTTHFEIFWSKNSAPAKPQSSSSVRAIPHLIKFHFWCSLRPSALRRPEAHLKIRRCEKWNVPSCISLQNSFQFNPFVCPLYRTHIYTQQVSLANGVI